MHDWAAEKRIHFRDNVELITRPEVLSQFQQIVNSMNKNFGTHEHVKRFRLVPDEWNSHNGLLSPTLKLKRKSVFAYYQAVIEEIYGIQKSSAEIFQKVAKK